MVIDESSGSSGTPNNWVRGPGERASVKRLLQHGYALTYRDRPLFVLNCFTLGPWATGMNVSMSLLDVTIMKSIGPDRARLHSNRRLVCGVVSHCAPVPPLVTSAISSKPR